MANLIYPLAKTAFLKGQIDLLTGSTLKGVLVSVTTGGGGSNDYTYSAAHEFYSSVASGTLVSTAVALSGKSVASGALTASPLVFPTVALVGSKQGEALIIFNDTGTPSTSRLVARLDTLTGLSVLPNGADITVTWAGNVFTLS